MSQKMSQDEIMPLTRLKQILAFAESERLGCAFGVTQDKKDALLLVDKKLRPRKVRDQLKADGGAALEVASLRYGEISVDAKIDPGVLHFSVNRPEAGGTLPLMTHLAKKAGYHTVIINADLAGDDEEGEGYGAAAAPAPPPPPAPNGLDGQAARLTSLVGRIAPLIATDHTRAPTLTALARNAQALILAGKDASDAMRELATALDEPQQLRSGIWEGAKESDGPTVALGKASQLWRGCRAQMHAKLDHLKAAIVEAYADEPAIAAAVGKNLSILDAAFDGLDNRLDDALDAAISATDPESRARLMAQVHGLVGDYARHVATNPLLHGLDENPFGVAMALKETLAKVLTALAGLSRAAA